MGEGYSFVCKNCHREYEACWGLGFASDTTEEVLRAIRWGRYGLKWMKIARSNPDLTIDENTYVYVCEKCEKWRIEPDLSFYRKRKKKKDPWFIGPLCENPNYILVKKRIHKCRKCKVAMHMASYGELETLRCPRCGGKPDMDRIGRIYWD